MDREAEFKKLLDEVGQEYFNKRKKPAKHAAPFLYEMDAAVLVGDRYGWCRLLNKYSFWQIFFSYLRFLIL